MIRPTDPPRHLLKAERAIAVARLALLGDRAVGVIARLMPWEPQSAADFNATKTGALATLDRTHLAGADAPRLGLFGQDVDGTRMMIDAAAD